MASDAQIAANRRNAENSTGPRTPEGKEQSRRNALRHGLAAEHILLVDEDPEDFRRFNEAMRQALAPDGEAEDVLADRIVLGNWRLRRVWRTEAAAINEEAIRNAHEHAREEMREHVLAELRENPPEPPKDRKPWESPPTLASIAYDVVRNLSNAQIEEAVTSPGDAPPRAEREPQKPDTPAWPEQRMTALSRYEAAIERALHRATIALERLQARRREADAPAPEAAMPLTRQQRRFANRKFAERTQFAPPPPRPQDAQNATAPP